MRLGTPAHLFLTFACTTAGLAFGQTTARVSVGSGGVQSDRDCSDAAISANGRHIAFITFDSNLVPGDTNSAADVFVRDRAYHTTTSALIRRGCKATGTAFSPRFPPTDASSSS
jgi:hypothetical protein